MANRTLADVRDLACESADLFRRLAESSHQTKKIGSLVMAGTGTVLVGAILLSLTLVQLLAWVMLDQPMWLSYAAVGVPVLGIGIALMAVGRRRMKALEPLREKSAKVMRDASTAVEHVGKTVETARQSLHETVDSVRESLDLHEQFNKRPWTLMAGAMSLGFISGALLPDDAAPARAGKPHEATNGSARDGGTVAHLFRQIKPEMAQLRGIALGALFGVVRDLAAKSAPQRMEAEVETAINGITTKLGGTPMQGHVLREPAGANGSPGTR